MHPGELTNAIDKGSLFSDNKEEEEEEEDILRAFLNLLIREGPLPSYAARTL